ncbi:biotin--[acetyl-CoA-carboxylase] ligase [Sulfurimonas lithotrophica]|uniref:Biotin--[acetyl-CoA-carboxylase] ligase n=1 Tax=Sulfurimonas lithotrophica TaxID=2590022 RepID=A0A5P8NZW6_9BACT|nr:biotin--[acetyl-CoA-carboxylase] ligase [Sulfurimonas lithotrophica]QFR48988.1 biotin--[acetyl-CoA-carboxylase] ligase [Sulfurimonas lithotrophica]
MKITYLKSVDSTQTYLKNLILKSEIKLPHAVCAEIQNAGIGSRNNKWSGIEGNLFLSFAIKLSDLPKDLKLESASIYFAYILKETLAEENSKVFLKWPNDFYVNNKKIGGMITNIVSDVLICGVGLNLVDAPEDFEKLDIVVSKEKLLNSFFKNVQNLISWKQIFSKYKLEFYQNRNFFTHNNTYKVLLSEAELQDDGSIIVNGERIYSLR